MPTDQQAKDGGGSSVHIGTSKSPSSPWPNISGRGKWSVSSYKFGFGAECLRDGDPDTFWHSDGPQPHFITVEFPRKVAIQKLSILLNYPLDDSYTPTTLAVRAGTGSSDLQDVRVISLEKPDGWITFDLSGEPSGDNDGLAPVYAFVLQVIILANHMNGKDTHVRGLRVLGIKPTMVTPSFSSLRRTNYTRSFDEIASPEDTTAQMEVLYSVSRESSVGYRSPWVHVFRHLSAG